MRQTNIRRTAALLTALALLMTGCGGPPKPTEAPPAEPVQTGAPMNPAAESGAAETVAPETEPGEDTGDITVPVESLVPKIVGTTGAVVEMKTTAADETPGENGVISAAAHDDDTILFWADNSPAMKSIVEYVKNVTDRDSPDYLDPQDRIAVFDLDGTLCGERFPTYFDQSLMLYRLLHDVTYKPDPEIREYAEKLEYALLHGEPEPEAPRGSAQITAESFKGFSIDDYREYVHEFLSQPVTGFSNMTYRESLFSPMVALVEYLSDHKFKLFICSGTETTIVRELTGYMLDKWIPPYQVIGSTFSLGATEQGSTAGRDYYYAADDQVILTGNLEVKNQKLNKVLSIVNEIGQEPVLVFGNSSSDFSMAQYALQNGGKAYIILCDDTERDYGDPEEAEELKKRCEALGFETISMRDEFTTIYGEGVMKTSYLSEEEMAAAAEETEKPEESKAKR